MAEYTCEPCGFSTSNPGALSGHKRSKKHLAKVGGGNVFQDTTAVPGGSGGFTVEQVTRDENYDPQGPAIIPGWRQTQNLKVGLRTVKMLRAICRICEAEEPRRQNWMRDCTHNPYVSLATTTTQERVYEDERDAQGNPTGRRVVTATRDVESYVLRPNRVQVALSRGVNSEDGVRKAQWRKGFLFPQDLGTVVPSEDFPHGIAPACEFRGCWEQRNLKTYMWGTFCREDEARLVAYHENGAALGALEVGWSADSEARRRQQLDMVAV